MRNYESVLLLLFSEEALRFRFLRLSRRFFKNFAVVHSRLSYKFIYLC